jgi:hypothetical protein
MNNQPEGSTFIIRIFTFHLPRTISLIHNFQNKFEKIKIIKNEWFDSFMPFRYLIGINYLKNKVSKSKVALDFETYNQIYFSLETLELIKIIKYIKSDAIVNLKLFSDYSLIDEWINKWFSSMYF